MLVVLFGVTTLLMACQKSSESPSASVALDESLVIKVTKDNFINGKVFCKLYTNTEEKLSQEQGKWVRVPKDYKDSSKGYIEIYAYTRKTFNNSLPTVIFVDGGPGQNTHQIEDILPSDQFNQINFDQRGVGCSTPDTWEQYSDESLYSSANTVLDMDEIRKAFGINSWSVYGVSYGTIPATIYASKFRANVNSVTLEGVLGSVENLGRFNFKAEKWNLVLKSLNQNQRLEFDKIITGNDEKKQRILLEYFGMSGYRDAGYRQLREKILLKLFPENGGFNEEFYQEIKKSYFARQNRFKTPQQPGAVDDNILIIFYCKELGAFDKDKYSLDYNFENGFFEKPSTLKSTWKQDCHKHNIYEQDQNIYDEAMYPVFSTVYYMQGSHDAATIATGAWSHWSKVPKSKVFFLFSIKGGHNPGLSKIDSENSEIKLSHQELYRKAFMSEPIDNDFIKSLNSKIYTNEKNEYLKTINWQLYTKIPRDFSSLEMQLDGFRKTSQ